MDHVESLNTSCSEFKEIVHDVVGSHKRIRRTLQCHLQLLELLELPQLVESCARNGSLDEALELAAFVKSLERRQTAVPSKSSVIYSISIEVSASLAHMRRQLLLQLTGSVSITRQVYIVATLRKLDGILSDTSSEIAEIRRMMDYLEARTFWINCVHDGDGTIVGSSGSNGSNSLYSKTHQSLGPYGQSVELLENRRTSLYTVITQFKALFLEVEPEIGDEILRKWISHHVILVLRELHTHLSEIKDGSAVKALMEQAVYFAKRLADEGADFTSSVLRLFSQSIRNFVGSEIADAHVKLLSSLEKDTCGDSLGIPLLFRANTTNSTLRSSATTLGDDNNAINVSSAGDIVPPMSLLMFPPLCWYINSILTAFNYLRACPLLSVYQEVYKTLCDYGWNVVDMLVDKSVLLRSSSAKLMGEFGKVRTGRASDGNQLIPRLDRLYAEAVAFDVLPHIFISLLMIFRKLEGSSVIRAYDSCRDRLKSGESGAHLLNNLTECEAVFGLSSPITQLMKSYWQRLADYKLITEDFSDSGTINETKKITVDY